MSDDDDGSKKRQRGGSKADPALLELAGRVQAVMLMAPAVIDTDALRQLLAPPRLLRNHREVGIAFGVSANTIGNSWAKTGMPGTAGAYDAVEICVWHLERESKNRARIIATGHDAEAIRELASIELETARATLKIRQARAEREVGGYINFDLAVAAVRSIASQARDHIMGISKHVAPHFCKQCKKHAVEDIDRVCRNVLTAFAESAPRRLEEARDETQN